MNRRTWKEFITKRSTIWTLSLCLVGAIVLGSMAAVNKSRNNDSTSGETELDQIAYLEEDLDSEDANGSGGSILADGDDVLAGEGSLSSGSDASEEVSGSVTEENTSVSSSESNAGEAAASESSSSLAGADLTGAGTDDSADMADTGVADESTAANSTDAADGSDATDGANAADASTAANSTDAADGSAAADSTDVAADSAGAASSETTGDTDNGSTNTSEAGSGSDTDTSTEEDADSESASADSEEASSASIISEQALIEAGVSFTNEDSLLWPSAGTIVIDYSMDKSVYFSTLNQYKYNPALIISSDTGNQVLASAKGIVESITIDEETGTTLVLNIGNGYKLTYGQLMEPAVSEGDVVEAGDLLAYVSEPTKYYSTEGSNLYFAMTKDGEPVDPVLYLE
ncbi:MAG: peptidoglycan DD-metalloendopeptidase family protein [Lachnospiraceae bacterium]|nr:peptidoglycan DD-metalloendopeptidase family protein [Lachnospiraceae bacterium]